MSVTTRALYPSEATVVAWATLDDLHDRAGVSVDDWKEVASRLGDKALNNILLVAGMPPYLLTGVLRGWAEASEAPPLKQLRMAMLLNAARLKVNMELIDLLPSSSTAASAVEGSARNMPIPAASALPMGSVKVRLSQVVDQGSDHA